MRENFTHSPFETLGNLVVYWAFGEFLVGIGAAKGESEIRLIRNEV
jgi:hypothetical protein